MAGLPHGMKEHPWAGPEKPLQLGLSLPWLPGSPSPVAYGTPHSPTLPPSTLCILCLTCGQQVFTRTYYVQGTVRGAKEQGAPGRPGLHGAYSPWSPLGCLPPPPTSLSCPSLQTGPLRASATNASPATGLSGTQVYHALCLIILLDILFLKL